MQNDNINVQSFKVSKEVFFKMWLIILQPFLKLRNKEIELLERERNTIVPHIEEIENLGRKPAPIVVEIQNGRKYKPRRKAIDAKLRREIKIRDNNKCQNCGKDKADQIHHINENPSDNRKDNLELLCYDCHKLLHRKKVKS